MFQAGVFYACLFMIVDYFRCCACVAVCYRETALRLRHATIYFHFHFYGIDWSGYAQLSAELCGGGMLFFYR